MPHRLLPVLAALAAGVCALFAGNAVPAAVADSPAAVAVADTAAVVPDSTFDDADSTFEEVDFTAEEADTAAVVPDSTAEEDSLDTVATEFADSLIGYPEALRRRADKLLENHILAYSQVGLCVYDLTADSLLLARNSRQRMRPASCQKIVTAATAAATLGSDYRLTTTLLLDPADSSIVVRAGFDPLLSPDDLRAFANALRGAGVTAVKRPVIVDRSLKDTLRMGWGWCWDDDNPPLSALLCSGRDSFAPRFRDALRTAGILCPDSVYSLRYAPVPPAAQPIAVRSHTLQQVVQPMLKRSDNLMAEALFYHIAAHSGKPYAGRHEATAAITALLRRAIPGNAHYQVADGSGLSLYNYTTPEILLALLRYVHAHADLYDTLFPALPVMGKDGTLRRRCHGQPAQHRVWAKTGTVEGVSTLAGYAMAPNGHHLAFVVMNQGVRTSREGQRFQDLFCNALTRPLRAADIQPDALATPAADDERPH